MCELLWSQRSVCGQCVLFIEYRNINKFRTQKYEQQPLKKNWLLLNSAAHRQEYNGHGHADTSTTDLNSGNNKYFNTWTMMRFVIFAFYFTYLSLSLCLPLSSFDFFLLSQLLSLSLALFLWTKHIYIRENIDKKNAVKKSVSGMNLKFQTGNIHTIETCLSSRNIGKHTRLLLKPYLLI